MATLQSVIEAAQVAAAIRALISFRSLPQQGSVIELLVAGFLHEAAPSLSEAQRGLDSLRDDVCDSLIKMYQLRPKGTSPHAPTPPKAPPPTPSPITPRDVETQLDEGLAAHILEKLDKVVTGYPAGEGYAAVVNLLIHIVTLSTNSAEEAATQVEMTLTDIVSSLKSGKIQSEAWK